jgi:hypothetical protein
MLHDCEYRTRFLMRFCGATENIGGGGVKSFPQQFTWPKGTKGASALGPQLSGEVVSTGGRGQKKSNFV